MKQNSGKSTDTDETEEIRKPASPVCYMEDFPEYGPDLGNAGVAEKDLYGPQPKPEDHALLSRLRHLTSRVFSSSIGRTVPIVRFLLRHPLVLLAIAVCFFAFSFFGEVVDEVLEGESHAIDEKILLSLRDAGNINSPIGPPWLEELMRDFTGLGGIGFLTFVTLAVASYLFIIRRKFHAYYLLAVIATGTILSNLLKLGFDRPRPDLVPHDSITYMAGFPSGHSFMATVVYLTLGAILAETQSRYALKIYLMALAIFLSVMVGVSRVYLGVHWPSDVLAGWLIGTGWALSFWILAISIRVIRN